MYFFGKLSKITERAPLKQEFFLWIFQQMVNGLKGSENLKYFCGNYITVPAIKQKFSIIIINFGEFPGIKWNITININFMAILSGCKTFDCFFHTINCVIRLVIMIRNWKLLFNGIWLFKLIEAKCIKTFNSSWNIVKIWSIWCFDNNLKQ